MLCLYRGYRYTKQLLAFNPLISNPHLHPFGTEEANYILGRLIQSHSQLPREFSALTTGLTGGTQTSAIAKVA